ncbi:L-serine ammonia-lyase [Gordonia sp. TBRC 11910]|uniref:L-serine dehydratase n=1 Tax=Gordonia asplenii TaxID=2725283 RepID=A0A848KYL3_9ACTN|nr:L-serine ammonia-lyase [Gordonia asplenii]NMO03824.1 L-serine ammonia-lyase [Gordonia asplenii]
MTVSVFDLFTVGIGPSSSHTVGPMRAAADFAATLDRRGLLTDLTAVRVDLYGSLAATGAGHGTMAAILLGLEGHRPDTIDPEDMDQRLAVIRARGQITVAGVVDVALTEDDMVLHPTTILDRHPNAMTVTAHAAAGHWAQTFYSIGGGFVITDDDTVTATNEPDTDHPLTFNSGQDLLLLTERYGIPISAVMLATEQPRHTEAQVRARLLHVRDVMQACQQRGMTRDGNLPGGLGVRRRAHEWYSRLTAEDPDRVPEFAEDWVNLVALAVNEENAAGGRIVTAPTNGAAGIIPAVLHYARHYTPAGRTDPDEVAVRFLLTAGAIGSLYKQRASISGAEVGCQGEVGSAASMAAAGLAEILGGTPEQVENAAEIAMEHSLGLTCDPIGGLVQIPCIERNAVSAGKAINAARMALRGDGRHRVSLDQVIDTMRTTGHDMNAKYKETATGGLAVTVAVNVVEC